MKIKPFQDNLYCENAFPKNCILYVNKCSKCQRRGNTYECTETDCYNPSPPLCLQYQRNVLDNQTNNSRFHFRSMLIMKISEFQERRTAQ